MNNLICWICQINRIYREYKGKDLLDEEGNKPCLECFQESEASKEESEDDEF